MSKHKFLKVVLFSFTLSLFPFYACAGDRCQTFEKDYKKTFSSVNSEKQSTEDGEWRTKGIPLLAYIENSGSMDGYVNGVTRFKTDIYSILSNSCISDSRLKLFYINSKEIPQKTDARSFVQNLTVETFKTKGGNRTSTELASVIENVLKKADDNNVVMLASDFIFSPEKQYRADVKNYLEMQKTDLKNTFEKFIKRDEEHKNAVVFLQGSSDFDGWFYNVNDTPFDYRGKNKIKRPFYILLAGNKEMIAHLLQKTASSTHFVNSYSEFSSTMAVRYEVDARPSRTVGSFRMCRNGMHHLEKIKADSRTDRFEFKVNLDLSGIPLNDSYLSCEEKEEGGTPCSHYRTSVKYYKVLSVKPIKDNQFGFTHEMTIGAKDRFPSADLNIDILKDSSWIDNSNDDDGQKQLQGRTFGLKPLLEGMIKAYRQHAEDYYARIRLFLEIQ